MTNRVVCAVAVLLRYSSSATGPRLHGARMLFCASPAVVVLAASQRTKCEDGLHSRLKMHACAGAVLAACKCMPIVWECRLLLTNTR